MKLAPVVLFVYNRIDHTRKTIDALLKNDCACETDLFIYSDASKTKKDVNSVKEIRNYIKQVSGFKKVAIIEREENYGLAKSIIEGVTSIINQYGKVIVLEDDLVTNSNFLSYMNSALDFYENEEKVYHIGGWAYPINFNSEEPFLWRHMNCWGWATWKDKWNCFEKDSRKLIEIFSKEMIYRFDVDGTESFWKQVIKNNENQINTWAIFWYASIFLENGLCVSPTQTLVKNIGFDGSGEHCNNDASIINSDFSKIQSFKFSKNIVENKQSVELIKNYYKNRKKDRFKRIITKYFNLFQKQFYAKK